VTRHGIKVSPRLRIHGSQAETDKACSESEEIFVNTKDLVQNTFSEESSNAARRIFKNVLSQLKSINVAKVRAHVARQEASIKALTRTFEDDLALLYSVDRAGVRAKRVKNVDSIPKDTKDIHLSHNFEAMFKSYRVTGNDHMQSVVSDSFSQSSSESSGNTKEVV
jgi:hypothetical protein